MRQPDPTTAKRNGQGANPDRFEKTRIGPLLMNQSTPAPSVLDGPRPLTRRELRLLRQRQIVRDEHGSRLIRLSGEWFYLDALLIGAVGATVSVAVVLTALVSR